uniref:AAA family ATPase n=1 Tax=Streptomyces sp. SBT349 TaxID=1580539 RepID=UPI00066D2822
MRLHRLTLSAFGPFPATQRIDFDQLSAAGLFLLHGPTGAGKTSILDAVCYALYASVPGARQSSAVSLRSDHAAPATPTEVVLDLTVGGRRLEITRRPEQERPKRRGTGATRDRARSLLREHDAATGAWRPLSGSHQEIGDELGRLLGMSRDQFCQVVLLPQGDFARFLRAGAEDRAKLLGRLFDTRRFAAAEAHLAELRATAVQRVRTGDERLLATAHRIQQAAAPPPAGEANGPEANGPAADAPGADAPGAARSGTPDGTPLSPGDPHLADTVLAWAAQARCTAREHRDIAATALATAEDAHAAAQAHHAVTVERARLQRAHADARRRAGTLAALGAEREETRARLARARAADAVAPALALRETAETEHREAADGERRARSLLPSELAEAPAAALTDRERAIRERLGALTAAARAEERARRLTAELDRLSAEGAADQERLADAERRLAPWPRERERLRERATQTQEAAATAQRAADLLDRAEQRLAAARRRDRLAASRLDAEEHLLEVRRGAADACAHWLDLKERRLRGIAAELAAALRPGDPCAVCGSPDHPRPARADARHVDRRAEDAALDAHRAAESRRAHAEQTLAAVTAELAAAQAAAGADHTGDLAEAVHTLSTELAAVRAEAAGEPAARAALDEAERAHEELLALRHAIQRGIAASTSRHEALHAERAVLRREIEHAGEGTAGIARRVATLSHTAEALAAATGAVRTAEESADRLKQADARAADAAYRAGFPTPRAAAEALVGPGTQRDLQDRLDAWAAEEAAFAAVLADPAATDAAALPTADPEAGAAALAAATARLRTAASGHAAATARCAELDVLGARAAEDVFALAPLRDESRHLTRLAGLTAGTSAENEYRMRLETYVLAARLEQVAAAASVRLHRMSAGRYALIHSDARAAHRARSGLGLQVMDAWTGRARDTASLSGGESFFVSLALALGLADVVAEEAGGRRLDTLFIDEGFGSLDEQSLDEVLDVLDALREHDRSVAIVSHVPDLRGRIPSQLQVVKTRHGSTVTHRTTPLA